MDLKLKGKKALVCAASRGLGLATAQALAGEGTELFLCARTASELESVAAQLRRQYGVTVHVEAMDLAVPGASARLAAAAATAMGQVDILINNIGGPPPSSAAATTAEAWQRGFEQVFLSSTLLTTALLPAMRERRFGRIITITSLSVLEPIEQLVVSTAMRLAVTGYAKTLASEVAGQGVTVNTVQPGVIHTGRIEELRQARAERAGTTLAQEIKKTEAVIPAGRMGQPAELAALVAFLASEAAGYITGVHIPVDGGMRRGL